MECAQARELLLGSEPSERGGLAAHLRACPACAAKAERLAWLDALVGPALLVPPPPLVAANARRAALAAVGQLALPARTPARGLSLAAYLLVGALVTAAAGLLGAGPLALLGAVSAGTWEPLRLALAALASWAAPALEAPLRHWTAWIVLLLLGWGLREAASPRQGQA